MVLQDPELLQMTLLVLAKIDERTIQKIQDIRDEGTMILMWSKMPRPRQIADKIFVLEEGKVA